MDAATWAKAKDLIGDALELPEADRDNFVAARCTDPALLAEIRSILRVYAGASSFLESPPVAVDGPADDPDDLPPGHQIGPYVVIDRLGRGGMGQVFLASDRRLKRKVALKRLLSSRHDRAGARVHILREARLAAQISHPHVATIHDVLDAPEGVFIVMEYVEGESLAARLRRERPPLAATLSIGRQLASALAAAHAKGVIHRDLKPANVQVMLDGTVKVLDFGIAQAVLAATTVATGSVDALSARVMIAGTPGYMSPEQMAGSVVDERSDLFSLGVVLFELIAGRVPFPGSDFRAESAAVTAAQLKAAAPNTPQVVIDLVGKALAVDVKKRFQTAAEMRTALEAVPIDDHTGTAVGSTSVGARLTSAALVFFGVVFVLGLFGVLTSTAFNLSLRRPSRFLNDSLFDFVILGFRANFFLLIIALLVIAAAAAGRFLMHLFGMVPLVARATRRWRERSARLGLNDPVVFGQVLATIGTVGLVGVVVWNFGQIRALQWVSFAKPEDLYPLSPAAYGPRGVYRVSVDLLLLLLGFGAFRLFRLRTAAPSRPWAGPAAVVGALLFITLMLHIVPYRLMFQNSFERLDVAGERCYLVDELENDAFIFCTEGQPPRGRVIRLDSPSVHRLGIFENMFIPPFERPSRAGQPQ